RGAAVARDRVDRLPAVGDVADHDVGTLGCEQLGGDAPETGGGTGDQRDLAVQPATSVVSLGSSGVGHAWSLPWIVRIGERTLIRRLNGPNPAVRSLPGMSVQQIVSPIDGSVYAERSTVSPDELEGVLALAAGARDEWQSTPLSERQAACERMVAHLES